MPQIPVFAEDPRPRAAYAPGAEIAQSSQVESAVSNIGQDIQSLGLQLQQRDKNADDSTFAFSTALRRKDEIFKMRMDLESKTGPDGRLPDGSSIVGILADKAKTFYEEDQKAAPSNAAKLMYAEAAGKHIESEIQRASVYENEAKQKFNLRNVFTQIEIVSNRQQQAPSAERAIEDAKLLDQLIDGQAMDTPLKMTAREQRYRQLRYGLFTGLLNQGHGEQVLSLLNDTSKKTVKVELQEALDSSIITRSEYDKMKAKGIKFWERPYQAEALKGLPERSKILDGMDPIERQRWIDVVESENKEKIKSKVSAFNKSLKTKENAIKNDIQISPEDFDEQFAAAEEVFKKDPLEVARQQARVAFVKSMGDAKRILNDTSDANLEIMASNIVQGAKKEVYAANPGIPEADKEEFAQDLIGEYESKIKTLARDVRHQRQEDFAGQVIKKDQTLKLQWTKALGTKDPQLIQQSVEETYRRQNAMNNMDPTPAYKLRPFSKEISKSYAEQFASAETPQNQAQVAEEIATQFGKYSGDAFSTIALDNEQVPDIVSVFGLIDGKTAKEAVLIGTSLLHKEDGKGIINTDKGFGSTMITDMPKDASEVSIGLSQVDGDGFAIKNRMLDAYVSAGKSLSEPNAAPSGLKPVSGDDNIKQKAAQLIFGAYDSVNHEGHRVVFRKQGDEGLNNKMAIEKSMKAHLDQDYTTKLTYAPQMVEPGMKATDETIGKQVSRSGFYKTTPDGEGMEMWYYDQKERAAPVRVKNRDGQVENVIFNFYNESVNPDKFTQKYNNGRGVLMRYTD